MTEKTFASKDGKSTVRYYVWEPEGAPKAILQIVHGMAEHITRYAPFAEYLSKFGVLVCGNDHIGHGKSADPADWGYFGESDGWKIMVQDVEQLHQIMAVQYMDVPYFIMGHSMGSFITRAWLAMYGNGVDGAVIMGTAGTNPALGVAKTMVSTLRKLKGSRHISKLVTGAAFGSYNKRINSARTNYDWLTRDNAIVDKYIDDPACGFTFTLAGYADLFNVIGYVSADSWYKLVPKNMPLLLVSGGEDPVGSYGQGPAEVAEKLQDAGCSDVSLIIYEGMRHEILNEIGKETVMDDIRRFIFGEQAAGTEDDEDVCEPEEAADIKAEEKKDAVETEAKGEMAEKDDRIFHDTNKSDDRHLNEQVLADAGSKASEKIDMTVQDAEAVVHKGIRKLQNEFEEAGAAATELGAKVKNAVADAAEKVEDKFDEYVDAFSKDAGRNVNEKVFEGAETNNDSDVNVTDPDPDAANVPHKGIRNIEKTLWEHEDK